MINNIAEIKDDILMSIKDIESVEQLQTIRVKYLGRSGILTNLLKDLKNVNPQDRPLYGKLLNDTQRFIEQNIDTVMEKLLSRDKLLREKSESIDVSFSKITAKRGALHPLTKVKNEIINIFIGLGFSVEEGPEIEYTKYNFELLNIAADHPARAFADSFYITNDIMLRTQTSGIQARVMEKQTPPIKIVCPGKVYRPDADATHSPMFQQIEGLYVDKSVSLADLKYTLELFAKEFFDKDTKVRFRPSYFPFTEPSVEVDLSCAMCHGKGCFLCKNTGWLELLGAGVVNPIVLENCGIDSTVYSGYAFGIGIERATMVKYGIPDMRLLFENDIRMLEQFK
ncbi:MAG: phenylalanine--tRNA ligase subunit alpha [Clostridiales bacterium]|nr:phenylalanine--tRNA ligase subunit alpha [Clostridiales bacterium]